MHKNKIHPKMAPLGGVSFYIGLKREILLKHSLSKTNELISTKFGRKHLWGMGIEIKGLAPFGAQKEVTLGEILGI